MKFKLTNLGNPSENIILYSNSNELAKILSIYGSLIEEVEKDGKGDGNGFEIVPVDCFADEGYGGSYDRHC